VFLRSPEGRRRWIYPARHQAAFTVCKCGWTELVKIDTDPISLWHALLD